MKLIRFSSSLKTLSPTAVIIGNFDGIHLGHQKLISKLIQDSKALGLSSVLCTFEPLSWERLCNKSNRLTNLRTKLYIADSMGVDIVVVVNFTKKFSRLSPATFIKNFLVGKLNAAHIITGEDFHFGADKQGNVYQLQMAQREGLFSYTAVQSYSLGDMKISSSKIREVLAEGSLEDANKYLGYSYRILCRICSGDSIGAKYLQTPTANLNLKNFLPPLKGVFVCWAYLDNSTQKMPALVNLGMRPTLGRGKFKAEVHLLNFSQNIYGKTIGLEFIEKLREEEKFNSLNELKLQIKKDKINAHEFFKHLT